MDGTAGLLGTGLHADNFADEPLHVPTRDTPPDPRLPAATGAEPSRGARRIGLRPAETRERVSSVARGQRFDEPDPLDAPFAEPLDEPLVVEDVALDVFVFFVCPGLDAFDFVDPPEPDVAPEPEEVFDFFVWPGLEPFDEPD